MNLSPHFTLEEMIQSPIGLRHGIDNMPEKEQLDNLYNLALRLEDVRKILGTPIHINSGFRCTELNKLIGGVPHSAHVDGNAADIIAPEFGTPLEIIRLLQHNAGLRYDQLIYEYRAWVHISFDKRLRQEVLTNLSGTYQPGLVP